jgi:hypothetical protein
MQMSVFCTLLPDVVYYNLWLNPKYVKVLGLHKAELITPGHKNQLTCYGVEISRAFNTMELQFHPDSAWKRSSKPAWNLPVPNVQ